MELISQSFAKSKRRTAAKEKSRFHYPNRNALTCQSCHIFNIKLYIYIYIYISITIKGSTRESVSHT